MPAFRLRAGSSADRFVVDSRIAAKLRVSQVGTSPAPGQRRLRSIHGFELHGGDPGTEKIPLRPFLQGTETTALSVSADKINARVGKPSSDNRVHDIESVEVGHLVVQHGDIRLQLANQLEALSSRAGLTDDIEIAALAQAARQPVTEEWMIINDHDPS